LAEAELEAISVLHAYRTLGLASFQFERDSSSGLLIAGFAETGEQRRMLLSDLRAAVHSAPWSAEIAIPEEARSSPAEGVTIAEPAPVRSTRAAAIPLLLEALRARLEPADAIVRANEIATTAVEHSAAAWTSAWNLKRLAQRFPDSTVLDLTSRGRTTLAHLLKTELSTLRGALKGVGQAIPLEPRQRESISASELFAAVERLERLTHALMSSGEAAPADPRAAMDQLLSLLAGLDEAVSSDEVVAAYWPALAKSEAAALSRP
jgi:hypothetical protein